MKILVANYTFDKTSKQITFTDINPIVLSRVLLITNVTSNVIIYNFSDPTKGGTAATNVLTLTYDTTSMANTDKLQIWYDDGATSTAINDGGNVISVDDGAGSLTIDGAVTVTNATASNLKAEVIGTGTFAVQATLAAETTKVIGVTRSADGSGNLLSSTSNALDVNIKSGTVTTHPVTIASGGVVSGALADGSMVTIGTKTDARSTATDATSITAMQVLKQISYMEQNPVSRAVTNAGTFAVQIDGNALTSLQLIDDTIKILGTDTYTEASTKGNLIGAVRRDANTSLVDTTNEIAPLQVNATGELKVAQIQSLPAGTNVIGKVSIDQTTPGTTNLVALAAGSNAIGKLAANSGIDIGDVDILSVIPGTGATNLGKAIDSALGATDTGVLSLAVRDDTLNIRSGTENDVEPLHTDSLGALWTRDTALTTDDAAVTLGTQRVMPVGLLADETSTDSVDEGDIGLPRMTLDRKQIVSVYPSATGEGLAISRNINLINSTLTVVKNSAGKLFGWFLYNNAATTRFVKFYDATSGTYGTGTPALTIPIPAGAAANVEFTNGIAFATGICVGAGTGVADNDTGAPSSNDVVANIFYK